jgi:toxin FitB
MRFLADANLLSEPLRLAPDAAVEAWLEDHHDRVDLAAFTLGELLKGAALLPAGPKKNRLNQWIGSLEIRYQDQIHPFDNRTARVWADYYAHHQKSGRKLSIVDSILAAVALQRNLTVATRNTNDFPGVPTVNPWRYTRSKE